MRLKQLALSTVICGLPLVAGSVSAQSVLSFADIWMDPNEFVLTSTASQETLSFDERRPVRVCLGEVDASQLPTMAEVSPPNDTPLRIDRTVGSTIILEAGTCVDFAAQHLELSPVGAIAENWSLHGTVSSRSPAS